MPGLLPTISGASSLASLKKPSKENSSLPLPRWMVALAYRVPFMSQLAQSRMPQLVVLALLLATLLFAFGGGGFTASGSSSHDRRTHHDSTMGQRSAVSTADTVSAVSSSSSSSSSHTGAHVSKPHQASALPTATVRSSSSSPPSSATASKAMDTVGKTPEFVYGGKWALHRSHASLDADTTPTPSCHATTLVHLPPGNRILMAWFGGTFECAEDVAIWTAIREADGTWGEPTRVAKVFRNVPYNGKNLPGEPRREGGEPHWNPVLFCADDDGVCHGTIHLYFKVGWKIAHWETFVVASDDGGTSWSEPAELVPGDHTGGRGPVKNKPIKLSDGAWVSPASLENPLPGRRGHQGPGKANQWRAFVDISRDEGQTWHATEPIYPAEVGVGVIQPTLWESSPGHVHMMLRSSKDMTKHPMAIWRSDSKDGARTWSPPHRVSLPNNNAGLDVARVPSGALVLVYNHQREGRYPLRLALSDDNGATWPVWINIETEPGEVKGWHEFSYPSIVPWPTSFDEEGVSVSYTWHRVRPAFFAISVAELRRRSEHRAASGGGADHAAANHHRHP